MVGDKDGTMTFKAIQIYDDYIRFNISSVEQASLTKYLNNFTFKQQKQREFDDFE